MTSLGEKLQALRKASSLSQEQLAAQLTVSRQAVSKWELNEAVPDTDNIIQLSRLFGVSTDYLLLDELEAGSIPSAGSTENEVNAGPGPSAASAESVQIRGSFIVGMLECALGLLTAMAGWWLHHPISVFVGLILQVAGVALFELLLLKKAPRAGAVVRLSFYAAANWLLLPIPTAGLCWLVFVYAVRPYHSLLTLAVFLSCYLLFASALTALLLVLRHRARKKAARYIQHT